MRKVIKHKKTYSDIKEEALDFENGKLEAGVKALCLLFTKEIKKRKEWMAQRQEQINQLELLETKLKSIVDTDKLDEKALLDIKVLAGNVLS